MIDTVLQLETPEGVTLNFKLAGFSARGLAWLIDLLVRILTMVGFSMACGFFLGGDLYVLNAILFFFLEWLYPVYFEYFHQGQTPGKKSLKLRVINEDGTPIGLGASLIRNFLRMIDFFPVFYGLGLFFCLVDKKFRRLGDLAARSVVVYVEEAKSEIGKNKIQPKACPVWLNQDEQKAILAFLLREKGLTKSRQAELAELLKPIHQLEGEEAVKEVQAYASYIGGQT